MPTASVQITPNYSLETIQQESQPSKSSFQPSSFDYVIFVASFLILLMIAFVVWFNFFRKRREAKAKLNITPDAASSLESLMESPLRLSHTLDRDIVVVAMPNQGETRFLQLFNEIKSRSNVRLVIPENCEMDIFKNMDIWISNCIKKYQRFLVLLTLDLVSDEDVSCSSPFCEVNRILFRRLLLNVNSTEEITKKRLFYIFLDPPVDILHYASQGLTESQPYKHTYDLSQERNCLDQTSRLLSDLMNSF
ncbi:uncharacterized protein LOC134268284 [Saccostrea cucullata]|uniref:uncharacterized protein LOC134268284 n=1 Tax=Saccostrea cuccullata TaxID=36930 RepID=UPI002ECFFF9E